MRRPLTLATSVLLALGAGLAPRAAEASVIPDPVSSITVSPSPRAGAYDTFSTSIAWCVPDGSAPGDSFRVSLPDLLGSWPGSFPLKSADGTVVANGAINPGPPSVLDVTLTDAVSGLSNVCGTATLQATARYGAALPGTTQPLTYVAGSRTFTTDITFDPGAKMPDPRKWGAFTTTDQCRTDGFRCLRWGVETQVGPLTGTVRVTDTAPAGATIDCDRMTVYYVDEYGSYQRVPARYEYDVESCTPQALSVVFHDLPSGLKGTVSFPTTVTPTASGGVTYSNSATVAVGTWQTEVSGSTTSNTATGTGSGTALEVHKSDTLGNAGDTRATHAHLPDGTADIVVTARNTGLAPLTTVHVDDSTVSGTGTLSGLSCDFSQAVPGAPTSGTVWAGPWPVGTTFTCTGRLTGVTPVGHNDVVTVVGVDDTGRDISGSDPYYALRPVVSVGDRVWWDADRDGVQDAGEKPAAGVTVRLLDPSGAVVRETRTDAAGFYAFVNLEAASTLTLVVVPPAGATFTVPTAGPDRATDSDVDRTGRAVVTTPRDGRNEWATPDGSTFDAGLVLSPTVSVGDRVWWDADHDGLQDAGERGISGVTLTLLGPDLRPAVGLDGRPVPAVRTDAAGRYLFSRLPALAPGMRYTVKVATPAGMTPTLRDRGRDRTVDSSTTTASTIVPMSTDGARDLSLDFGFWKPTTRTYSVEIDRIRVDVPGNPAATQANRRLVYSLDDDGVLRYRENKGTRCEVRNAPTCLWYRSTWTFVTVHLTTDATVAPTKAQILAAVNAKMPRGVDRLTTTGPIAVSGGVSSTAWILGKGALPRPGLAWGPSKDVPETYLGRR